MGATQCTPTPTPKHVCEVDQLCICDELCYYVVIHIKVCQCLKVGAGLSSVVPTTRGNTAIRVNEILSNTP